MNNLLEPFEGFIAGKPETGKHCYLYKIITDTHEHYAIVGLMKHDLFLDNTVLPHEETLPEKEKLYSQDFITTRIQENPVSLFYKEQSVLSVLLKELSAQSLMLAQHTAHQSTHMIYKIKQKKVLNKIQSLLANVDRFYIADGHHRVSALLSATKQDKSLPKACLCMLVADSAIKVGTINRCIKRKLNGDFSGLLNAITEQFHLAETHAPDINHFHLFMKDTWYRFQLKAELLQHKTQLDRLPPFLVDKHLFKSVFSITNQREDTLLDFIPQSVSIEERLSVGDADIAVCIPALTIDQIRYAADMNKRIPPHTTYLEPKPLNNFISWKF